MKRLLLALVLTVAISSCVTQQRPQTAASSSASATPSAGSTILVMAPDIQLSLLTTAGLPEPRADWSQAAEANIAAGLGAHLQSRNHPIVTLDPNSAMEGRSGQLIRLHDAVATSILLFQYGPYNLSTHPRSAFNWTLGPGTREIQTQHNARYALFIGGGGAYSSAGRVAATVIVSLLFQTVATTGGGQQLYCSLVDLETGQIVWFNIAQAGSAVDMRTPEGARELVNSVLRTAPL